MPRDYRARENAKRTKARRDFAIERRELRGDSHPRRPTASPTSFPLKAEDPVTRKLIDEALAFRRRQV